MIEVRIGSEPPPVPPAQDSVLDYLTLLVTLVSSIAWPAALVLIVLIFRKQLVKLAARVRQFSGPAGIMATFADELEKTREVAERSPLAEPEAPPEPLQEDDPYLALAKTYPEAAVMNAYKELEAFFSDIERQLDIPVPAFVLMRVLRKANAISPEIWDLYNRIRITRNAAVHSGTPVTPGEALEFRALAQNLLENLRSAKGYLEQLGPDLRQMVQEEQREQRLLRGSGRKSTY